MRISRKEKRKMRYFVNTYMKNMEKEIIFDFESKTEEELDEINFHINNAIKIINENNEKITY